MDYPAYFFLLVQMYLLAHKPYPNYINGEKTAFLIGTLGSICMVGFGLGVGSIPCVIVNCFLCYLNFVGFLKK